MPHPLPLYVYSEVSRLLGGGGFLESLGGEVLSLALLNESLSIDYFYPYIFVYVTDFSWM